MGFWLPHLQDSSQVILPRLPKKLDKSCYQLNHPRQMDGSLRQGLPLDAEQSKGCLGW